MEKKCYFHNEVIFWNADWEYTQKVVGEATYLQTIEQGKKLFIIDKPAVEEITECVATFTQVKRHIEYEGYEPELAAVLGMSVMP